MSSAGDGQPYYKLSSFQHVIRELPLDTLRIAYSSAIAPIMTVRHCSEDEARDYIRQVVLDLKKVTTENHLILSCHPTRFDLRTLNGVVPQYTGQVLPAITQ